MRNPSDLPRSPRNPRSGGGGGFRLSSFKRGRAIWSAILAIFVVGGISVRGLADFYVDVLWHNVVGRSDVFWGVLTTKVILGAIFVVVFTSATLINLWLADRLAPSNVPVSLEPSTCWLSPTSGEPSVVGSSRDLVCAGSVGRPAGGVAMARLAVV